MFRKSFAEVGLLGTRTRWLYISRMKLGRYLLTYILKDNIIWLYRPSSRIFTSLEDQCSSVSRIAPVGYFFCYNTIFQNYSMIIIIVFVHRRPGRSRNTVRHRIGDGCMKIFVIMYYVPSIIYAIVYLQGCNTLAV